MEHTTGLTDDEFDELLVRLRDAGVEGNPSIPGPFGSLQATPVHLRNCLWRMHIIAAFRAFPSPTLGAYPPTHRSRRQMSRSDNSSAGSPVVLLHDDVPFLMRLLRLTEHPINRLCQTSRLAASALTRAELNRSRILASTPRAKATAETASTVLSSSPPS